MLNLEQDEAWLAQARARVAAGAEWERTPEEIEAAAKAIREARKNAPPGAMCCPYCDIHPPLQVYPRYEMVTQTPLRFCPSCFGFWAAGDSLSAGIADPYDDHPALRVAPAPRRCRACNGHLGSEGICVKCKRELPRLNCPACRTPMERFEMQGITLDHCDPCDGVWFDTGEIAAVFGVEPPRGKIGSLAEASARLSPQLVLGYGPIWVPEPDDISYEPHDDPPGWLRALHLLERLFLRGWPP